MSAYTPTGPDGRRGQDTARLRTEPMSETERREQAVADWLWEHDHRGPGHSNLPGIRVAEYLDHARDLLDREELFPAPQQPPAQEQVGHWTEQAGRPPMTERERAKARRVLLEAGNVRAADELFPAPVSEADNAGEVERAYCLNCTTSGDPDVRRVHDPADCPWRPETFAASPAVQPSDDAQRTARVAGRWTTRRHSAAPLGVAR